MYMYIYIYIVKAEQALENTPDNAGRQIDICGYTYVYIPMYYTFKYSSSLF
jgi:hypothetical protein